MGEAMNYYPMPVLSKPKTKAVIKTIFAYPDPAGPIWPNIGYDFDSKVAEYKQKLLDGCKNAEFRFMTTMIGSDAEAKRIIESDPEVDGYLYFLVGCLWGNLSEALAQSGKPMIMVDHLYAGSGEFLTAYAWARRKKLPVIPVSSSDFNDVIRAVRYLETMKMVRNSTMLVVGGNPDPKLTEIYGINVKGIDFKEINKRYEAVTEKQYIAKADEWIKRAKKVVEPKTEEIRKSAAMYLAMAGVMEDHKAQAITVNCLGGIYSEQMVCAYPCIGFMELDDQGFVGACEADQRSTITKLIMSYLTGRPGFISDPVIDTSKNQIIYAHCVASSKVYGPDGPYNPFHIRSHSEDRKGAAIRSLMPLGEMTTTLEFDHGKKQIIFHQGVTVENVDEDMACRSKLAVEVKGDVYKLLNEWDQWGWHRVTFFGDLKREVETLATLYGFEMVYEA
jgi:L-fucose isomerase-like protein